MKNSKLIFALSLLLACTSIYSQSIQTGPTLYEMNLEWPLSHINSPEDYGKQNLTYGKFDNFAIKDFYTRLCTQKQECTRQNFNPLLIKLAEYKYLSSYFGFTQYDQDKTTYEKLKYFFEIYTCCLPQQEILSFLINSHKKYSIVKTLESKGIVPSKTKVYTIEQFHNALKDLFGGVKPLLWCQGSYLTGIKLTLDRNLNVTKDCEWKGEMYGTCNVDNEFLYLPL